MMARRIEVSVDIANVAFTPDLQMACGATTFSLVAGRRDKALAMELSSPWIYKIWISYCDNNSCHQSCLRERSRCTSKLIRVLWSVYT